MLLDDPVSGIELAAVLPSLRTERGRRYHDLLLQWKPLFSRIDIPVSVITEDVGDRRLQDPEILYIQDTRMARRLGALQEKAVFGTTVPTIRASLYLVRETEILAQTRRMAAGNFSSIWKKAFALQMEAAQADLLRDLQP